MIDIANFSVYNIFMKNKVVLITGASNGIGCEIARVFANNGYSVIINYNQSKEKAEILANEIIDNGASCLLVKADISDVTQVQMMVEKAIKAFGHIDVLINNAGIASSNIIIDESYEKINKIINTNLNGTIYCSKECAKHMIKNNYGKIVNISSVWGLYGASGESIYSASKGGVIAFTKALSKELIYSNINVNAIAPGCVDTDMMKNYSNEELENIKSNIPLNRFASTNEIAELALYLASDNASYITGQTIQIDGGFCN